MNILEFLNAVSADDPFVQELARKLDKVADGFMQIPVLNAKLDSVAEQLKSNGKIIESIPVLLERYTTLMQTADNTSKILREHESKLSQLLLFDSELKTVRKAVYSIIGMLVVLSLAALKHILSIP